MASYAHSRRQLGGERGAPQRFRGARQQGRDSERGKPGASSERIELKHESCPKSALRRIAEQAMPPSLLSCSHRLQRLSSEAYRVSSSAPQSTTLTPPTATIRPRMPIRARSPASYETCAWGSPYCRRIHPTSAPRTP